MLQIDIDDLPEGLQALLKEAKKTNTPTTITQAGRPFAVVHPSPKAKQRLPFGFMKGPDERVRDIISPVEQPWEVLQ